jgi:hypothetical protein
MADLFDRIVSNPDNEEPPVGGHYLPAMVTSYHNGDTAASIKTFFNMDANAQADFDAITTHFDGLTALQKGEFLHLIDAATVRIELGIITTKTEYATFLGI